MTQPPNAPGPQDPHYGQQPGQYPPPGQYQGHPGYGQPPKKSKKKWVIGCLGLTVLAILLFAGCAALLAGGDTVDPTPAPDGGTNAPAGEEEPSAVQTEEVENAGTVTLEATATTTGMVMWMDMDGSSHTEEFTGTWSKEIPLEDGTETYTLSVTGDFMDESSEVSCKLYVDGELKDEATGTGSAGSASCSQPLFG